MCLGFTIHSEDRRFLNMTMAGEKNLQFKKRNRLPTRKKILFVILSLVLTVAAMVTVAYLRYLHPTGTIISGLYAIRNDRDGKAR